MVGELKYPIEPLKRWNAETLQIKKRLISARLPLGEEGGAESGNCFWMVEAVPAGFVRSDDSN